MTDADLDRGYDKLGWMGGKDAVALNSVFKHRVGWVDDPRRTDQSEVAAAGRGGSEPVLEGSHGSDPPTWRGHGVRGVVGKLFAKLESSCLWSGHRIRPTLPRSTP